MASGHKEHSATDNNSCTTTSSSTEDTTITTTDSIENRQGQQKWSIIFQEGRYQLRLDPMVNSSSNNSQLHSRPKTPKKQPGSKYIRIAPAPAPAPASTPASTPAPSPSASHLYLSNRNRTFIAGNALPRLSLPCESLVVEQLEKLKAIRSQTSGPRNHQPREIKPKPVVKKVLTCEGGVKQPEVLKAIRNLQTTDPKKRQLGEKTPKPKAVVKKVYGTAAGLARKRKNEQRAIPVAKVTPWKLPRRSSILDEASTNTNGGQPRPPTATVTRDQFITLHYVQDITDPVPTTVNPPQPVEIPDFPEQDKLLTSWVLDSDVDMNEDVVLESIVDQNPPYSICLNGEGQGYGALEFDRRRDQDQLQQAHDPSTVVCCPCQLNSSPFLSVIRPICTCSCLECEWQKCI